MKGVWWGLKAPGRTIKYFAKQSGREEKISLLQEAKKYGMRIGH